MNYKKGFFFLLTCLLFSFFYAQELDFSFNEEDLTVIPRLSSYDPVFKEYSKIVENNYKLITSGKRPDYYFFLYTNTENFTLQGLCSRCNINYDTIATLNHIESSTTQIKGKTLILPTVQGLFITEDKPQNHLEIILRENYNLETLTKKILYCKISSETFSFCQSLRLTSTERAYFLDSALGLPLDKNAFWVSSEFGKRANPFSGKIKNHNGIDLAAEEGTPVYAIKDGAVAYNFNDDPELGNYIILQHDAGKTTSVYAHLSKVFVDQYETVRKGDIIGLVGQTGMVTGPHLHFEIRTGGKAEDPRQKLNLQ